jgi:hypothetical protein
MAESRALPSYCHFGDHGHQAAYAVDSGTRECLTCLNHLEQAKRWAGPGTTVTPLQGHEPPPEQPPLF